MYECLNLSGFVLVSRAGPVSRDNVVSATVAAGGGAMAPPSPRAPDPSISCSAAGPAHPAPPSSARAHHYHFLSTCHLD